MEDLAVLLPPSLSRGAAGDGAAVATPFHALQVQRFDATLEPGWRYAFDHGVADALPSLPLPGRGWTHPSQLPAEWWTVTAANAQAASRAHECVECGIDRIVNRRIDRRCV